MKDALTLLDEAAAEPSLDELAKRARAVLALASPSEAELRDLIAYWRKARAAMGTGAAKESDDA